MSVQLSYLMNSYCLCAVGDCTWGDCGPRCGWALSDDLPVPVPQIQNEAWGSAQAQTAFPKQGQSLRTRWAASTCTTRSSSQKTAWMFYEHLFVQHMKAAMFGSGSTNSSKSSSLYFSENFWILCPRCCLIAPNFITKLHVAIFTSQVLSLMATRCCSRPCSLWKLWKLEAGRSWSMWRILRDTKRRQVRPGG